MKFFFCVLTTSMLLIGNVHADDGSPITCRGRAMGSFFGVPFPIMRDITVTISDEGNETSTISSQVDGGGSAVTYTGNLILDGGQDMIAINPDSGDIAHFNALLEGKTLFFKLTFTDSSGREQGGFKRSKLKCNQERDR